MTAGEAITIAPLEAADVPMVAEWLSKPDINRWLTSEWRDRVIAPPLLALAMRNKRNRFYLTRFKGAPCGLVALAEIDPDDAVAMVWYALGRKDLGGRGVTSRAVRQLAGISFRQLGLECLYAWIIEDNAPSRRVLEKAGFCEQGVIRDAVRRGDARLSRRYFDLTKADYERQEAAEGPVVEDAP